MALRFIHGSIRRKLVSIVILATLPAFLVLLFGEFEHQQDHVDSAKKDATIFLHGFTEVQRRITDSTKALLQTVAVMPEIRSGDAVEARKLLGALVSANPIYANAILLDTRGDVVAMGKGKDNGLNFADRKQFRDALETKRFSFGEFIVGKVLKKAIFPFSMPVLDDAGEPLGVISIAVDLQHYATLFDQSDFSEGTFFGLCDRNGIRLFRYPMSDVPIGKPIKSAVFEAAAKANATGAISVTDAEKVKRIIVFEPLRIEQDNAPYMYMFMGLDENRVMAEGHAELMRGGVVSGLSLCVALMLAWWLGHRTILVKIDRLAETALKIGRGEGVPDNSEYYTDGELGQLFRSFDTMAGLLQDRECDLLEAKNSAEAANKALRTNMSHMRTLMETMPELVWLKNADGFYLFCNNRFERFFGAREAEIIGKTDYDFVAADVADHFRECDMRAMQSGSPMVFEETICYADDGHMEDLETIKTPLVDDSGRIIGVLGVARDITERKRIADELRESEMRFKALHNASFGGIAIHDKGVILDCNQGLSDISGFPMEELVGMDGLLLIAEHSRPLVMGNIVAGYEDPYEAVGLRSNGEEYPLRLEARNIPYKGKPVRAVEFRDITIQKQAEAKLRDSEQRHRVIFEKSPLGMVRFSEKGIILDCNEHFVDLMGSTMDALIGFNSSKRSSKLMREALHKALDGEPASFEDYYTSVTGGKTTFLHVEFNPVNEGQSPTEVIATLEDVSERKQVQDNLRAAKEQAESYSRSKSEFLTNMSHEIRTPLNGILGMLQLMQTTGLSSEQEEYVVAAVRSSKRLTTLLTDILDLSRVEAGKLVVQRTPFDLRETLEQVCDLYKLTAEQSGVELRRWFDGELPSIVLGDAIRLQQVLTNLVGNAYKFTSEGHISIEAHNLAAGKAGECRVLFVVSDTGVGIPDNQVQSLFEAFTQGSQGYTREHQGAGLGLSICKHLIELMGGSISIEAEEGKGSTFYVSIPFGQGVAVLSETTPQHAEFSEGGMLDILLAEDERVNSLVTERLLSKAGHTVTIVDNGRKAVDAVREHAFDVVLMDIQMPVMDGVEATRAIRNGEAGDDRRTIPIIAATAYAMVGDREKFMDQGMDGYVVKPIEVEALKTALVDVTGESAE